MATGTENTQGISWPRHQDDIKIITVSTDDPKVWKVKMHYHSGGMCHFSIDYRKDINMVQHLANAITAQLNTAHDQALKKRHVKGNYMATDESGISRTDAAVPDLSMANPKRTEDDIKIISVETSPEGWQVRLTYKDGKTATYFNDSAIGSTTNAELLAYSIAGQLGQLKRN